MKSPKEPMLQNMENAHLLALLTALCMILLVITHESIVQAQLIHLTDIFAGGAMAVLVPKVLNGYKNGNGNGNGNSPTGPSGN